LVELQLYRDEVHAAGAPGAGASRRVWLKAAFRRVD
jgi:hypothetical protein